MPKQPLPLRNERGIALVAALVIMALLIVLGTIALNSTVSELQVAGNDKRNRLAFYAAESGVQFARAQIRKAFVAAKDAGTEVAFVTNFDDADPDPDTLPDFTPPTDYAFTITPVAVTSIGSGTAADPYCFMIDSCGTASGNASSKIEAVFQMIVSDPISSPIDFAAYAMLDVTVHGGGSGHGVNDGASVEGDIYYGGSLNISGHSDIEGTATTDVSDPLELLNDGSPMDLLFDDVVTTNDNADVPEGYLSDENKLTIPNGVTLLLPPGDYYFTDIVLQNGASIEIDGSGEVNIYLDGSLEVKNSATINADGLPTDFSIFAKPTADEGDSIQLRNDSQVKALIYAPTLDVTVHNGAIVNGAILGSDIDLKNDSNVIYDEEMANKDFGDDDVAITIASWREI